VDVGRRAAGHIMIDRGGSAAGPKPGAASSSEKLGPRIAVTVARNSSFYRWQRTASARSSANV
jgi:hypothetical protein